ncbi:Sec-independent protein translocase protein TatB [Saccharomonospora viridis]|uniref:Sec-independent protein translocase protein TatB n=2 Tax=Saccharomonospora viridis TaxID=1852 RepID=C7MVJ8_SACVD|nr:Sec-independent protein translocase protein TatB [Saccharomonospora viridis]ACU95717.1 twin arginine-targeting protein translocase TatB [Saccharomonospora viridis DSM 43017]KHF43931.1 preprotein translocase subunit TatB [Saccharomonospora viridis]SFP88826.1 sec-independent protein translocase protein TatB [Saccharomonospora viridis]
MFDNIGWSEILILIVAGLFILGPERLPEAAAWLGRTVRKIREFATGARQQLREEVGTDLEEFRKPIEELRNLRNLDPKQVVTKHLFDGDPDPLGLNDINGTGNGTNGAPQNGGYTAAPRQVEPLKPGEKPPVDPDAT